MDFLFFFDFATNLGNSVVDVCSLCIKVWAYESDRIWIDEMNWAFISFLRDNLRMITFFSVSAAVRGIFGVDLMLAPVKLDLFFPQYEWRNEKKRIKEWKEKKIKERKKKKRKSDNKSGARMQRLTCSSKSFNQFRVLDPLCQTFCHFVRLGDEIQMLTSNSVIFFFAHCRRVFICIKWIKSAHS